MRRELAIGFGAPITWWIAAAVSLVVGHSFVLAVDLYTAASQSTAGVGTMTRGLEPLLGIVAPTMGAASFCVTLLGPVLAARLIAVERERKTLHALVLRRGAPAAVLTAKGAVTLMTLALMLAPVAVALGAWSAIGGHLGGTETLGVLLGASLHAAVITGWGCAAAAWTRSFAAAIALTVAASVGSWVLDGASDFAALSWLAPAARLSLTPHLDGLQRGVLSIADLSWLLVAVVASLAVAYLGLRSDLELRRRIFAVASLVLLTIPTLGGLDRLEGGWDLSESRRASLPVETTRALRAVEAPITIDVWLDRDDARRRHVERDALLRLRLALDDLTIRFPLDQREGSTATIRDEDYGLIAVTVGDNVRSTRSTARRELSTMILEVAGHEVPPWRETGYDGHALEVDATSRGWVVVLMYVLVPLGLAAVGTWLRLRS